MQGLVIGGGIGGLTTAIAMRQHGMVTRVYEAGSLPQAQGAGLVLAINAMRVMDRLHLSDQVVARGNELSGMNVTDEALVPLTKNILPYFQKKYGQPSVAIHRSVLQELLVQQLDSDMVEPGKNCVRLKEKDRQVIAEFEDGEPATGDYAIVADGLHSGIRKQLFPTSAIREATQICWRGIARTELPAKYSHHAIEAWGRGKRFGFVAVDAESVYWYAVLNKHGKDFNFRQQINLELGRQFNGFAPLLRGLIAETKAEDILRNDLMELMPLKQWHTDRICLVGDAAHAMTPNIGQGACQAMEDAWEIAVQMEQYKNPSFAFPAFQKRRKKMADYTTRLSHRIGGMAQYEHSFLVGLRNQIMKRLPGIFGKRRMEKIFDI